MKGAAGRTLVKTAKRACAVRGKVPALARNFQPLAASNKYAHSSCSPHRTLLILIHVITVRVLLTDFISNHATQCYSDRCRSAPALPLGLTENTEW